MTTALDAYKALSVAADRIGVRNYAAGHGCHTKTMRGARVKVYVPTAAHRLVVDAMPAVLSGDITPSDAMGLLWTWDVMTERGLQP